MTRKVSLHCPKCGSEIIIIDAVAAWDRKDQDWKLCGTQDSMSCLSCGAGFHKAEERELSKMEQLIAMERLLDEETKS